MGGGLDVAYAAYTATAWGGIVSGCLLAALTFW
jgi:hypothetical protein